MAIDTTLTFNQRDEYNRKPIAEKIIRLLSSDVDVSPLIIDGGWGTGKTEFCHKLINLIEEKNNIEIDESDPTSIALENEKTNIKAIYVDAFKADHADEPLMTLLASVLKLFPEDKDQQSLKAKALPVLRFGAKTLSKGVVSWILQQDFAEVADELDDVIEDASNEVIDKTVSSMLDDHIEAEKSIEALKIALKELTQDNPITIFVDELDRCRPDFAISMLESIKHIFDVEGVKFILIANTDQLKASIKHCYGEKVSAHRYLDKFIGYKFEIPSFKDQNLNRPIHISQEHFMSSVRKSELLMASILKTENTGAHKFVFELILVKKLSLREVETFIQYLEIYQVLTEERGLSDDGYGYKLLNIMGVFLYCFKQKIFNSHESVISINDVLSYMENIDVLNLDLRTRRATPLEAILVLLMSNDLSKNPNSSFNSVKGQFENWEETISGLFKRGYDSYEDDAIESLLKVKTVLSLR